MKIIALMNSFWVGEEGGMSGSDRRLLEVAKWWKKRGIEFEVFTSADGFEVYRKEDLGEVCRPTAPGWADRLGLLPSYFLRILVAILKIPKFSSGLVAYSSSDFLTDVVPAALVKFLNRDSRWVALSHHVIKGRPLPSFFQKIGFFIIKRFSDLTIAPSLATKGELLSFGFSNDKVVVIPNGLNIDFISKISGAQAQRSEACFLARLNPSKGIYDLPKIWKEVTRSVSGARLFVVGGGKSEEVEKLKKAFFEEGVFENVKLLGYVSEEEKYTVLRSSKIFISPSYEEGFGIAVLEAMACGLPVVAWDLPVYREIFKKGMIRVPLGGHKQVAAAIIGLLSDEKKRAEMGQEAKSLAQEYDWEQAAAREWVLLGVK